MLDALNRLFEPSVLTPHGFCLAWEPGLVMLHVSFGILIALAYFSIPMALLFFMRHRRDFPYPSIIILFAAFIMLCGASHVMDVITLWQPFYWLQGTVKALTAIVSVITAVMLWPLLPEALALPAPSALHDANARLAQEVEEKNRLLADLQCQKAAVEEAARVLEARVAERTESLAAANRTFRRRVAALPAVIYGGRLDAAGQFHVEHVSESIRPITGWTEDALATPGRWQSLMDPGAVEARACFFADALATGAATMEYQLSTPDDRWIWVRDHVGVADTLPDGGTEVIGYLADITMERDIHAKIEANGRLAVLGQMAAGLAHELNQPLAIMALAADNSLRALGRSGAEAIPTVTERLKRIAGQAERARDIVDHLRIFGRTDSGEPGVMSLQKSVQDSLNMCSGPLRDAGIEVTMAIPSDLPDIVGRAIPLEQTVLNLLLNARDAIVSAGQDVRRIDIAAKPDAEDVVLTVADSGPGIPDHVLPRIFDPFFTTKEPGKGTGLGLSIAHSTVRSFGGQISVRNGDRGAIFELRFKAAAAQPG